MEQADIVAYVRAQIQLELREVHAERARRGWETRRRNQVRRAAQVNKFCRLFAGPDFFLDLGLRPFTAAPDRSGSPSSDAPETRKA
jgi:hypothetical protein